MIKTTASNENFRFILFQSFSHFHNFTVYYIESISGLEMARSREKREIACAVFFKAPLFIFFVALYFEITRRARHNALRLPRFILRPARSQ